MIGIVLVFTIMGLMLCGLSGYMPELMLQGMMFIVGMIISLVGLFMLYIRAIKTGAIHLLNTAQPNSVIWFYIQRDGTVKITPAFKRIEGMTESKEMDAIIQDMKAYRIFDHQIRFVPEDLGHSADVKHCVYARIMKNKYGFESIRDGRRKILDYLYKRQQQQPEYVKGGSEWED